MSRDMETHRKARRLFYAKCSDSHEVINHCNSAHMGFVLGASWADHNPSSETISKIIDIIAEQKLTKDMTVFEKKQLCDFIKQKFNQKS